MTDVSTAGASRPLSVEDAGELARRHGLTQIGVRPRLGPYIRETWRLRQFIWTLSTSQSASRHRGNQLGAFWTVLDPLLLAGSYFLIFGLLLKTTGRIDNFIAFLTTGIFVFSYTSGALSKGSKAVIGKMSLVRALHFPRVALPISVTLTEFVATLPAFGVLFVVLVASGERPRLEWLLFPVAIGVLTLMNLGMAMIAARIVNMSRDLANLVPPIIRITRYGSGIFFPIRDYAGHGLLGDVLVYQPFSVAIDMCRQTLMAEMQLQLDTWIAGLIWAVVLATVGFLFFWQDEARYGRG